MRQNSSRFLILHRPLHFTEDAELCDVEKDEFFEFLDIFFDFEVEVEELWTPGLVGRIMPYG